MFENEKDFLYNQTMQTKKKNKLLKVAIGKLQSELDKITLSQEQKTKIEGEIQKSQLFLTDVMNIVGESKRTSPKMMNTSSNYHPLDVSNIQQDISTMQFSLQEPSVLTEKQAKQMQHKRYQSVSGPSFSRYANIPTENIKFEKFVDLLFASKMSTT